MSDNQFILQSSKIESKLKVGKKNKRGKEEKRKAERFPIRSFFSLAPGGFPSRTVKLILRTQGRPLPKESNVMLF